MNVSPRGTALVTGASAGIGAIYADRLARRGYDLILVARSRGPLDDLAKRLATETGRTIDVAAADLNNKADLARVENILRTDPRVTVLVNNAGVAATAPLLTSDVDKMDEMISLNVTVLTRLTYAALPGFVARGGGTIINIASIVAITPETLNGVYGGTKAFVLAFSRSLHSELAQKNIRIQAVLPGATATDLWEKAGMPVEQLPKDIVMRGRHGRRRPRRSRPGRAHHDPVPSRSRRLAGVRSGPTEAHPGTIPPHTGGPIPDWCDPSFQEKHP